MVDVSDLDEEKLFRELWNIIDDVHSKGKGFARSYPTLYRLYLRVATKERIESIKRRKAKP
jgi:hypothetical protein